MMSKSFFSAKFCAECGKALVTRIASCDGSAICLECRAIEDMPTPAKRELLRKARELITTWDNAPEYDVIDQIDYYISENIAPIESAIAQILTREFSIGEDDAIEQAQSSGLTFEEWTGIIKKL